MKEIALKVYVLQAQILLELEVVKKYNVLSSNRIDDHR